MTENEIRRHVHRLAQFYKTAYSLAIANVIFIMIYLFQGSNEQSFWPLWPILLSGIYLLLKANRCQIAPDRDAINAKLENLFPCFKEGWEDDQVKKMMAEQNIKPTTKK